MEGYHPQLIVSHVPKLNADAENFIQSLFNSVQKFNSSLINLTQNQLYKYQCQADIGQQQLNQLYPFVMTYSSNEIIAHLGPKRSPVPVLNQLGILQLCAQHHNRNINILQQQIVNKYNTSLEYKQIEDIIKKKLKISDIKHQNIVSYESQLNEFKHKEKRDFKNMPKNYTKAIIIYAQSRMDLIKSLLTENEIKQFLDFLNSQKNLIFNIKQLKALLTEAKDEQLMRFSNVFRILGLYFLKNNSVEYIFNSKIIHIDWHMKYRRFFIQLFSDPAAAVTSSKSLESTS